MPATRRAKSSHSMYEPLNRRETFRTGDGPTRCLAFEPRGFLYQLRSKGRTRFKASRFSSNPKPGVAGSSM